MSPASKQQSDTSPEAKDHLTRFPGEDWARLQQAMRILNERENRELTASAYIRMAVRQLNADVLDTTPAASETVSS